MAPSAPGPSARVRTRWNLGLVLLLALAAAGWLWRPGAIGQRSSRTDSDGARLLATVIATIQRSSFDAPDEGTLYRRAASSLLTQIHDPYAALLIGDGFEQARDAQLGRETGVGLSLVRLGDTLLVDQVVRGSPADSAGILVGERVLAIDDHSTVGVPRDRAAAWLRGAAGSRVTVQARAATDSVPRTVVLARARVVRRAVTQPALLTDRIGYVALREMTESAGADLRAAVDSLYAAGARGLVLDLRGNRGGLLRTAVELADLLLPEGARIGELHGKQPGDRELFAARHPEAWPGLALALLIDRETASAAEILAAALQDHDRAIVVGTATYGKGVTQSTIPIGPDVALKLTTGRWYAPSGRPIQRGLTRDAAGRPTDSSTYVSDAGRPLRAAAGVIPDVTAADAGALDPALRRVRELIQQRAAQSEPLRERLERDSTILLAAAALLARDPAASLGAASNRE